MGNKLDVAKLELLLQRADDTWFRKHSGIPKYHEHRSFTAEYIAKHYSDSDSHSKKTKVTN